LGTGHFEDRKGDGRIIVRWILGRRYWKIMELPIRMTCIWPGFKPLITGKAISAQ